MSLERELAGALVVSTRRPGDSDALMALLQERGAQGACVPMIQIGPPQDPAGLDRARAQLSRYHWIALTSQHAAAPVLRDIAPVAGARPYLAAVGEATADAARQLGWGVQLVADGSGAATLADAMLSAEPLRDREVLFPRSDKALPALPQALRQAGAKVDEVEAYRTLGPTAADAQRATQLLGAGALWLFASPSAARHLRRVAVEAGVGEATWRALEAVAIGATTAAALEELGLRDVIIAPGATPHALLAALAELRARR